MLHDLILALLGVEGDFVVFDKSGTAQLTQVAKSLLQISEISLIESKILSVASLAISLRGDCSPVGLCFSRFYEHAWLKAVRVTLDLFYQAVADIEDELIAVPDLSISFFARKLAPWEAELRGAAAQAAKIGTGPQALDVATDLRWSGETARNFRNFCVAIFSRQVMAFCVYGEIVGDFWFEFDSEKYLFRPKMGTSPTL